MIIKMNNQTIETNKQALMSISSKVHGKVAYAISRNLRKLTNELEEFINERDNLIREYGDIDEQGQVSISPTSPRFNEFSELFYPMLNVEQEIEIMMLKPEELYETDLTGEEMFNISFMVED